MFKKQIQNGRNLERMELSGFGGLNTAAFASDKEFSELINLTNEEWPYLSTKEPAKYIVWWDTRLLAKDKAGAFEEGYITNFAKYDDKLVFIYGPKWKNNQNNFLTPLKDGKIINPESQEQVVMANGDYILFPSMVHIKVLADNTLIYSTAEYVLSDTHDGEEYHQMLKPDGNFVAGFSSTELDIAISEGLYSVKNAYLAGDLNIGDTLKFEIWNTEEEWEAPKGFSEDNLYTITAIDMDKKSNSLKLTLSATDSKGDAVSHGSFSLYNNQTNEQTAGIVVKRTNPFKLGCSFGGRLFCCDVSGNSVWISKFGEPFDFSVDASDAGGAILSCLTPLKWTAITSYAENVYCFKRDKMFRIDGSGSLSYEFTPVSDLGALNQKAVTVIGGTMYFMNESGIYRFSGGEMQLISSAIEKELSGAKSAILGGHGHVLYAAVNFSDDRQELFVYDQKTGYWHTETPPSDGTIYDFCDYAGKFMCATSKGVYQLNPEEEGSTDTDASFSLVTKEYFYLFDKKAVGEVNIRMEAEEPVYISVCYDGKEWTDEREVKLGAGIGRVPVKLRKCTTFKIKVKGNGKAKIYAMEFSLYTGGRYYGK